MIDVDRLSPLDGRRGPARQGRAGRAPVHLRRLAERDLRDPPRRPARRAAHPAAVRARRAGTRASGGSGASSRRSTAPRCRTPRPSPRAATPDVLGRGLLPDGVRRRLVADGPRDRSDGERPWPAPFDTDLEARARARLPARRGHRPARQRRLAGQGARRPRPPRRLPRAPGRPVDRLPRADQGPRAARLRRGRGAGCAPTEPIDFVPGLMHGDYQFANVMYEHGAPARLAAIVDWEMGTVGDPKLDLGWVVQSWPDDTIAPEAATGGYVDMYGMPSTDEVLAHYAAVSGRQVDDIDYYVRPRPVEARRRARAGLPAGRRRREAAGVRAGRARAHAGRGRPRRVDGLPVTSE